MNIDADGNYFSIFAVGANDYIRPEDVKRALEGVDFDLVVMQLEMPLETVYRTYEMARERKIPVFLDAGPAMSIPLERLRGIFVISPNEAETAALTGIAPDTREHMEEAARWLYEKAAPRYVLLKLGSRGALLYDGREMKLIGGCRVQAVDTTAAGDEIRSKQPMTSLFEQSLLLLGDTTAMMMVEDRGIDVGALWQYHANLE